MYARDNTLFHNYNFSVKETVSVKIKWPSMQRWQCQTHNGTCLTFLWSIMWKILSFFKIWKCFILIISLNYCFPVVKLRKYRREVTIKIMDICFILDQSKLLITEIMRTWPFNEISIISKQAALQDKLNIWQTNKSIST